MKLTDRKASILMDGLGCGTESISDKSGKLIKKIIEADEYGYSIGGVRKSKEWLEGLNDDNTLSVFAEMSETALGGGLCEALIDLEPYSNNEDYDLDDYNMSLDNIKPLTSEEWLNE